MIKRNLRQLIKPLPFERREKVVAEIRPMASPGFDFFFLVVLSCSIATLGLITDSPAVIIGAMLIAPLMSPIIGIGLASITGDAHLLENAIGALLRGAALAVLLSAVVTRFNLYVPFLSLQALPNEILVRTHPSPLDLGIALAGGMAAAYALTQPHLSAALPGVAIATALMPPLCTVGIGLTLGRMDVAGGALLLFLTNTVTIAFAAVLVFFLCGFGASNIKDKPRLPRSLLLSASLTLTLFVPLNVFSVKFIQEATENRQINTVVRDQVAFFNNAELVDLAVTRQGTAMDMNITIRTSKQLRYEQVVGMQEAIVAALERPVSIRVNQIFAEQLDPLIPPTRTPTPTVTATHTLGPSPTTTLTQTPTATFIPTSTATPSPTSTPLPTSTPFPTSTPTSTHLPQQAIVILNGLPRMQIYQSPGGPAIGPLRYGQQIQVLYREKTAQGLVWVEIQDVDGRIGWVPLYYLQYLTSTPTPSLTPTSTSTVTRTMEPSLNASIEPSPNAAMTASPTSEK